MRYIQVLRGLVMGGNAWYKEVSPLDLTLTLLSPIQCITSFWKDHDRKYRNHLCISVIRCDYFGSPWQVAIRLLCQQEIKRAWGCGILSPVVNHRVDTLYIYKLYWPAHNGDRKQLHLTTSNLNSGLSLICCLIDLFE